ncbi:hypothetical protein D3C79_1015800 [compost metagenome]
MIECGEAVFALREAPLLMRPGPVVCDRIEVFGNDEAVVAQADRQLRQGMHPPAVPALAPEQAGDARQLQ